MKRILEKVKDIVEVRSHGSLVNFGADPTQTVYGYHFTDVTADLMTKWINGIAKISNGQGSAKALAGFRGVGKSHFLATLGALLAHPELRSRIADPLVGSTAHALARRQFPVAFIRRGTYPTLLEELQHSLSPIVGEEVGSLSNSINELLMTAASKTGDLPLVLIIDTAFERSERVSRDDGAILAEIADTAISIGAFVGIALDDDISGADGANSAISKTYAIDYLDQEHLYKIVDSHIFPKHQRMLPVLHDIYEYYRQVVPGFRWSEQRFTSLYPLHPAIMEIAPFVRLYLHEFALLGFASEAGTRIMGRPANSLIAPDEVFDNIEKSIRSVDSLKDVLTAFDNLSETVVAKTPVMKRLQAKLILKGLFLFSLNDEGVTAAEIGASMLIFDENKPDAAVKEVETMLAAFAQAKPEEIQVSIDNDGNPRFTFKLFGKDDLKSALAEAAKNIPQSDIDNALKELMNERFVDCSLGDVETVSTDCYVVWRGGIRNGRVFWQLDENNQVTKQIDSGGLDWRAIIQWNNDTPPDSQKFSDLPLVIWKAAELRDEESETLRRLIVLKTDSTIRSEFKEHIASAVQTHTVTAEKILQRSFLNDAILVIGGFEYNLTDEARAAPSLSHVTTIMFESLFEGRFPMHPYFSSVLGMKEVSSLVADLFSGARPNLEEVQRLAAIYALPLNLVEKNGESYSPVTAEVLLTLPRVKETIEVIDSSGDSTSLDSIFKQLGSVPNGLIREGSYLILAAMVGQQVIEFVTSTGDRINRRSMDLKIIWDDIKAVARPVAPAYSNARLLWWAAQITGNAAFKSLESSENRLSILESLQDWLATWKTKDISTRFDELSDHSLNARIWRLAMVSTRSFNVVADSINSVLNSGLTLDSCLQRIADVFSDSEAEFLKRRADLVSVEDFVGGAATRDEAMSYLALCGYTGDAEVDTLNKQLYQAVQDGFSYNQKTKNADLEILWQQFRRSYSALYADKHDDTAIPATNREKLDEILKTDIWWEFENLSDISVFDANSWRSSRSIIQKISRPVCKRDVIEMLDSTPFCACSFTLDRYETLETLPDQLWLTINQGIMSYRKTLIERSEEIVSEIENNNELNDEGLSQAAKKLCSMLRSKEKIGRLTEDEMRLLRIAFTGISSSKKFVVQAEIASDQNKSRVGRHG